MLSVIYVSIKLTVTNKPFKLSVVMISVIMLSVIMLSVAMLSAVLLCRYPECRYAECRDTNKRSRARVNKEFYHVFSIFCSNSLQLLSMLHGQ